MIIAKPSHFLIITLEWPISSCLLNTDRLNVLIDLHLRVQVSVLPFLFIDPLELDYYVITFYNSFPTNVLYHSLVNSPFSTYHLGYVYYQNMKSTSLCLPFSEGCPTFYAVINAWLTCNVEDGYFTEDSSLPKGNKHCLSIVCNNTNLSAFNDVHLLPNVALAADIVSRWKYLKFKFEDELHK